MPLEQIQPSESFGAEQIAKRKINEILKLAGEIDTLRTVGVPGRDAVAATTGPQGNEREARPAVAAISGDAINDALGVDNCAILDSIKSAIEG